MYTVYMFGVRPPEEAPMINPTDNPTCKAYENLSPAGIARLQRTTRAGLSMAGLRWGTWY